VIYFHFRYLFLWILEMPRPNKRKKQLAVQRDAIAKRRKALPLLEERPKVTNEDSSLTEAVVVSDTISSLHGKKRTPIATAIAEAATNTALPDVATSLPSADSDIDVDDDAHENVDAVSGTHSNNHPRVTEPSTSAPEIKVEPVVKTEPSPASAPANPSTCTHEIKPEPVVKSETEPAPANPSTSTQEIKLEPVVKTETAPEAANTSTDQAEAPIPMEPVINGPNLNRTVTVRRKVAKRTNPLYIAPPPQSIAVPLSPSPQAEEIPVTQEPRVEEPLPTTSTDEAGRNIASPDISVGLPTPATHPSTDAVNTWTRRRSRRQIELPPTETSEAQLDDDDGRGDLSGPVPPPFATVITSTLRRSSRRVIPTSSAGTPILPPCAATVNTSRRVIPTSSTGTPAPPPTATVDAPTLPQCRSRHQTQLAPIETSEAQLDDDDDGNSSGPLWEVRFGELADYRKIHGHCNVPQRFSENAKLANWVGNQRRNYSWHLEKETSPMTTNRIQALESLGFEWDSQGAAWKKNLSKLADYRKIHGHCNVPNRYSENPTLGTWVSYQRQHYKLHIEGKKSKISPPRIQALEGLGFEWNSDDAKWKKSLSELADYHRIHGHCNVPKKYSENIQLGTWVGTQRKQYKWNLEEKTSSMTPLRIQALESLGFVWRAMAPPGKTA
jgi:hypothetical protein